jgi:hypothetical protein
MANVKTKVSIEWYHRRFQAVGRAQSRYLVLSLLVTAYTFGLSFTQSDNVSVAILGLTAVPKAIVIAAAMLVLDVVLLALFGSFQAAREAGDELRARIEDDDLAPIEWHVFDEHPNVADVLGYATYVNGKPRLKWLTRLGALVLYPLPVLAFVLWAVCLWRQGFYATDLEPAWLEWVYAAVTILVLALLGCTAVFTARRWELFRTR